MTHSRYKQYLKEVQISHISLGWLCPISKTKLPICLRRFASGGFLCPARSSSGPVPGGCPALPVAGSVPGGCSALLVAGQGGTGNPRLPDPHKAHRFAGTP